eukprot:997244-Rhodomonas_salina.3
MTQASDAGRAADRREKSREKAWSTEKDFVPQWHSHAPPSSLSATCPPRPKSFMSGPDMLPGVAQRE